MSPVQSYSGRAPTQGSGNFVAPTVAVVLFILAQDTTDVMLAPHRLRAELRWVICKGLSASKSHLLVDGLGIVDHSQRIADLLP